MYFKSVNRGMAFTKAGFYMTGLVCVAGVLATGSGSNALFLTLGLGLSALVVSGILSEKVMYNASIHSVESVQAEEKIPFAVTVRLKNNHSQWTCYGLEILANRKPPRYRLLPSRWVSDFAGTVLRIGPLESVDLQARTAGQQRGHIRELFLTQTTLFPFNLVRKFKVDRFTVDIRVLPALDLEFLKNLGQQNSPRMQSAYNPQEFHSHRPLNASDTHRRIDWRKSTGEDPDQWVVKVFRDTSREFGILILPDWEALVRMDDTAYEKYLSRLYTAWHFAHLDNRKTWIKAGFAKYIAGADISGFLADFPKQLSNSVGTWLAAAPSAPAPLGPVINLVVGLNSHTWSDQSHGNPLSQPPSTRNGVVK
jgi:uncharacterized protein (DUF58 family)